MGKNKVWNKVKSAVPGDKLILIGATIVIFAIFTALNSNYLSRTNITNILVGVSLTGLIAIGHTYLIIAGQNDLSPGSVCAFTGVLCASLVAWGVPFFPAVLITLLSGALVGFFNAWMVNRIKIEAFIATLVSQFVFRGFAYILCDGRPVSITNKAFLWIGGTRFLTIPLSVWIMIVFFIIFGIILAKTKFGRSVYAIGGNKDAARLAGLNPQRIITTLFVIMGIVTALGGVSFTGGVGDMVGTALGVFLIQAFNTGLIMVNVQSFWQYVARGALLLFALTSDYIRRTNREKALLEASKKALASK